jgi:hypothetical protein
MARQAAIPAMLDVMLDSFKAKSEAAGQIVNFQNIKATLGQKKAEIDAENASKTAQMAAGAVETRANETELAPKDWGANQAAKKPLTAEQADAADRLIRMEPELYRIEGLEKNWSKDQLRAVGAAMDKIQTQLKLVTTPMVGGTLAGFAQAAGVNPEAILEKAIPGEGAQYWRSVSAFANRQLRKETGAVIGSGEYVDALARYVPSDKTSSAGMRDIVRDRRRILESAQMGLGAVGPNDPTLFWRSRQNKEGK